MPASGKAGRDLDDRHAWRQCPDNGPACHGPSRVIAPDPAEAREEAR
jgi:hypothetical protein